MRIWATPWYLYDIVLSTCQTLADQANWLRHMSEKRWVTKKDELDLLRAFEDLGLAKEEEARGEWQKRTRS